MKIIFLLLLSTWTLAQVPTQQNILQGIVPQNLDEIPMNELILDRMSYDDNIFSESQKTQLGDQSELGLAVRYHVAPMTFTRLRFVTDPRENRFNNKTSRFELIFAKSFDKFNIQIDLDILTNDTEDDPDSGGISIGPDLDSDDTFISYQLNRNHNFVFYPFNFRSDVGDEFNTLDVSRIETVTDSPNSIGATPIGNENVVSKTIPGLEYTYTLGTHNFYMGVGVATYFYPINEDFDIEANPTASGWERKETTAYKFGYLMIDSNKTKVSIQHLAHDNTDETGSLLESASSLNVFKRLGRFIVEFESTMSVAGKNPYNIDRQTNWFRNQTPAPFSPTYADINGVRQDWLGETGFGHSLKVGYNFTDITPFISLKAQDEHFIFDGDESAHILRNSDETLSHGGLTRIGVGTYFYRKNMFFRPYLEYQIAENPVFTNSTGQRSDRALSSFTKENYILSFDLTYTFDDFSSNQLWWF
jgi:hypothetical protein